ncbi:MAG TPA: NUDIX domain-containing protein [Bryobacteraceae bacterium]
MKTIAGALAQVEQFRPTPEEQKSHELILALLRGTDAPFSRDQFHPGHITCTALVLHPDREHILLMHHHLHKRWLLPGGHIEEFDATLSGAAARETHEETAVKIARSLGLAGLDVHGIPARKQKGEPFHLHHDLIFAFEAASGAIATTEEAPQVMWCRNTRLSDYAVPLCVAQALARAASALTAALRHHTAST